MLLPTYLEHFDSKKQGFTILEHAYYVDQSCIHLRSPNL